MPFQKGHAKAGGRQKNTPNKITASIRQAVRDAFESIGGKDWLVKLAGEEPRTFAGLLAKLMPAEYPASGEKTLGDILGEVNQMELAKRGPGGKSLEACLEEANQRMAQLEAQDAPQRPAERPVKVPAPKPLPSPYQQEYDFLPGQAPQRKVQPLMRQEHDPGTTGSSVTDWDPLEEIRRTK